MTTYVVLKPNVAFYALGGCYPVARLTKDFVFYNKTRGDDTWEEKISKKNVLFFSGRDISDYVSDVNRTCWNSHKDFEDMLKQLQKTSSQKYSTKDGME